MFVLGCTMVSGQEPRRHSIDTQMYSVVLLVLKSTCWSSCWEYNPNNRQYKAKLNLNGDQIPADDELLLLYRMSVNDIYYILLEILHAVYPHHGLGEVCFSKSYLRNFKTSEMVRKGGFVGNHPSPIYIISEFITIHFYTPM
jgi:hypothetical protein